MKQSDFLYNLKEHISQTASMKDPSVTANVVYFIIKQHPLIKDNQRTYIKTLKEIKAHLVENFGWRMLEVHSCFCRLNKLLNC